MLDKANAEFVNMLVTGFRWAFYAVAAYFAFLIIRLVAVATWEFFLKPLWWYVIKGEKGPIDW